MSNQNFRALQKIQLGGMEPPETIEKGEIISFDGKVLKREGGDVVKISQPSALATAIRIGWLVEVDSAEVDFKAKAAGVDVRSAISSKEKREKVAVMTVQDEERDIGTLSKVRPALAPPTHKASDAGKLNRTASTGAKIVREEAEGEGRVIGRLKNPANAAAIEIGKDDRKIAASLTSIGGESSNLWESRSAKVVVSGDVEEAMVGDELVDILPNAVSTGRPKGTFKDEGVKVIQAGSSVGGQEEGKVIGKIGSATPVAEKVGSVPVDVEGALREWASSGKANGQTLNLRDVVGLVRLFFRKVDVLKSELTAVREELEARKNSPDQIWTFDDPDEARAAFAALQLESDGEEGEDPGLAQISPDEVLANWDLTPHWKTRAVKAVSEYGNNEKVLQALLSIEVSGVKKAIAKRLAELEAE